MSLSETLALGSLREEIPFCKREAREFLLSEETAGYLHCICD